ncbi:hypothetical protein [Plantactinospora sp. KBS50]|uniref:hypothetical protein n=1 Tax=Plantactinospora sp. KBS50 TaxID=2024580 RepID=UPI000BAAF04B|nr:hypothetical protein [Plantactinospora sp. KBS50]ASW57143.1 hypothetical protein CIK06_27860 [Plantactinospora sp. KBS50]
MRRQLVRTLTAAILAISVLLPSTARPALAYDVGAVIAVIQKVYSLYKQYKSFTSSGSGLTLEEATTQILTAINTSQAAIISQIDLVATAQVRACATSAVIDFADIGSFSPDTLQAYARDATGCVTLANGLLSAVTDPGAIDQLAFALNEVGPLALVARSRAALSTTALNGVLIDSNNTAKTLLTPACLTQLQGVGSSGPLPGNTYTAWVQCTAYNGDTGTRSTRVVWPPTSNPFDINGATADAARRTAWPVTISALATLQS